MNSMKERWIKYLKSFGTRRYENLRKMVLDYMISNNLEAKTYNKSLEEILDENNLWYMLYL